MAVGLITSVGGGTIGVGWNQGTVLPPAWAQSVQDNVNQGLINANARAIVIPAYSAAAFTAAGAIGGWSDAGLNTGYLQTAATSNYLMFPISAIIGVVPTGTYGTAWGINSVSLRMKTSGAGVATLQVVTFAHQSSVTAISGVATTQSNPINTSGTGDQFVTGTIISAPFVFNNDTMMYGIVTAGNAADKVYSITVNYQNYGL